MSWSFCRGSVVLPIAWIVVWVLLFQLLAHLGEKDEVRAARPFSALGARLENALPSCKQANTAASMRCDSGDKIVLIVLRQI